MTTDQLKQGQDIQSKILASKENLAKWKEIKDNGYSILIKNPYGREVESILVMSDDRGIVDDLWFTCCDGHIHKYETEITALEHDFARL